MRTTRLSPQFLILAGTLLLWAVWPRAALWTLVVAYLVAWGILGRALPRGRGLSIPIGRGPVVLVAAVVLAAPAAVLVRHLPDLPWAEGTRGVVHHTADRARLEALPAVAPPVVFDDHPQLFYIHAPGGRRVALQLGDGVAPLEAEELGAGLFRVAYNPRRDGILKGESRSVAVEVRVDGKPSRRTLHRVRPLAHPRDLASDPAGGRACTVSEETDEIFLVTRAGLRRTVAVGDGPVACAFWDGGVVVAHRYTPELWRIDFEEAAAPVRWQAPPFAAALAVSPPEVGPPGGWLALATAGSEPAVHLLAVEAGAVREERRLPLDFRPDGLTFTAGGSLVVAGAATRSLFRYRLNPDPELPHTAEEVPEVFYLGRPAVALAASPPGAGPSRLYVAVTDYRPDGVEHRGNHFIQDQILTLDPEHWALLDSYPTARRTPRQTEAGSLDAGISPMGMVVLGDASLRVVFAGSDEAWHMAMGERGPEGMPAALGGYDLDLVSPYGVADLGADETGRYWAATTPAAGALAVFRDGEMVAFEGVTPPDDALAAAEPGTLTALALDLRVGERAFHETTRSGISCQSCHLRGGTDHSPHDIGQAHLLPTLTTRGVARTAPYLRDASFPRVAALDAHLSQTLYRGFERYLPGRAAALETFVESLPRPVNPHAWRGATGNGGLWRPLPAEAPPSTVTARPVTPYQRQGVAAYGTAGCALCHTFPAFTNLGQHPRGSLFPELDDPAGVLDTPSLVGLDGKHDFLQDGRAEDLHGVLDEHNPANRHGDTQRLSAAEKSALVAFLEGL
jgi:hypothetical protein